MANDEHLDLLKQGVQVWNKWRQNNPGTIPDFSGANLEGTYLESANLENANFSRANLRKCVFRWARLEDAIFDGAVLDEVDPTGTILEKIINQRKQELRQTKVKELQLSGKFYRENFCWKCKLSVNNLDYPECSNCGWIRCRCGACGCSS